MPRLRVTPHIAIDETELSERFVLASGPGGQNVNKVATAVQLRFDLEGSPALDDEVRARARALAGRRLTKDGILVLEGNRFRSQERNREDVRARLVDLLQQAAATPAKRRKTKPSKASKMKRLESKMARGRLKQMRSKPGLD